MIPAVYNSKWEIYSNKDLFDFYAPLINYEIDLKIPNGYNLASEMMQDEQVTKNKKEIFLRGNNLRDVKLYIQKISNFYNVITVNFYNEAYMRLIYVCVYLTFYTYFLSKLNHALCQNNLITNCFITPSPLQLTIIIELDEK